MIEINDLTKTYGDKTAVDHLSVTVRPGVVTGFLGPNGAGKSTTTRVILGLDRPTSGTVLINGRPYTEHPAPLREVGALLDAKAGRTVFVSSHLMSEMALTADHLVILGRGRLLADVPTAEMTAASAVVRVRSPQAARLRSLLDGPGVAVTGDRDELSVSGRSAEQIGIPPPPAGTPSAVSPWRGSSPPSWSSFAPYGRRSPP